MTTVYDRQRLLGGIPPEVEWLQNVFSELFEGVPTSQEDPVRFQGTAEKFTTLVDRLLRIASGYGIDLEQAVWDKYPGICPYCEQKPCDCGTEKSGPHRRIGTVKPRDFTLTELQDMLREIYPPIMPATPRVVWQMAAWIKKLHEEVWELVRARKTGIRKEAEEEFADVFARLIQIANAHGIVLQD